MKEKKKIAIGIDAYNQCVTGEVARTLASARSDSDHLPCVLEIKNVKAYGVTTKGNGDAFINEQTHTSLSIGGGQAGQGYPCVLVIMNGAEENNFDREEIL